MVFDSTNENKDLIKRCNDIFNGIRDKIKEISSDKCDYKKDYMRIQFNSDIKILQYEHNYQFCFWRRW